MKLQKKPYCFAYTFRPKHFVKNYNMIYKLFLPSYFRELYHDEGAFSIVIFQTLKKVFSLYCLILSYYNTLNHNCKIMCLPKISCDVTQFPCSIQFAMAQAHARIITRLADRADFHTHVLLYKFYKRICLGIYAL